MIEGAELLLHLKEGLGIGNGGFNFQTIADDPGILKECRFFPIVELGHLQGIEACKRPAVAFAA